MTNTKKIQNIVRVVLIVIVAIMIVAVAIVLHDSGYLLTALVDVLLGLGMVWSIFGVSFLIAGALTKINNKIDELVVKKTIVEGLIIVAVSIVLLTLGIIGVLYL